MTRVASAVGGVGIAWALALAGCQTYVPGSLEALKYDQWKKVHKECIRSSVHENSAIALYLDMGAIGRGCARIADDAVGFR